MGCNMDKSERLRAWILLTLIGIVSNGFWWAVGLFMGENTDIRAARLHEASTRCDDRGGVGAVRVLGYYCRDNSMYRWLRTAP